MIRGGIIKYIILALLLLPFNAGAESGMKEDILADDTILEDAILSADIWYIQKNILRTEPDDNAPFVQILMPAAAGDPLPAEVEVISRSGDWEEVRLRYWSKYNGSSDPTICKLSVFSGTFTGFRKTTE